MPSFIRFSICAFIFISCTSHPVQKNKARQPSSINHETTLSVDKIDTLELFKDLSIPSNGVIRQGHTIKFLIDKRDPENPSLYFFNANCKTSACISNPKIAVFHYYFAKQTLSNFSLSKSNFDADIYYTNKLSERNYIGGRIQAVTIQKDGADHLVYGVRFIERDLISEDIVQYAMEKIQKHFTAPGELSFVQNSQHQTVGTVKSWMDENKIGFYTMEKLMGGIPYIALNPGVAYGILNYFPEAPDDLEPYDLPVFDEVPLDLAVVSGTITKSFQDVGSHVNLKSKERNTPNMVLRDQVQLDKLKALDGKPVKLTVEFDKFNFEELPDKQIVFDEYERKIDKPWQKPAYKEGNKIVTFDSMCSSSSNPGKCLDRANEFGGKASSLSFLAHKKVVGLGSSLNTRLGYRLSPLGFAVPLTTYRKFVKHNYSGDFKAKLDKLILSEMSLSGQTPLPTAQKKVLVKEVRELFLNAEIPDEMYQEIYKSMKNLAQEVTAQYPGVELKQIKVRSSANTEDIDGFNGAGLHDSFAAKLSKSDENQKECKVVEKLDEETGLIEEKIKPKSLACAIKGTFASLWSLRAVRERSYRRFDHTGAVMGLAVHPTYKFRPDSKIAANSVLITRVLGATSVYGQQMSTQHKNGLVTNPTPGTRAELTNITFQSDETNLAINVIQYAKPKAEEPPRTETVMSSEQILLHSEIGRTVEKAYCKARNDTYFPGRNCKYITNSVSKPAALDMEFKTFKNGQVMIKQVRTFSGK